MRSIFAALILLSLTACGKSAEQAAFSENPKVQIVQLHDDSAPMYRNVFRLHDEEAGLTCIITTVSSTTTGLSCVPDSQLPTAPEE